VNRVTALARISDESLTIDFAARALQPPASSLEEPPQIVPSELIALVCRHLNLDPSAVMSARRNHSLTYARHIAMYLLRRDLGLTYATIAQMLGKKDHSTVVHACTQLERELPLSPELRADIDAIRSVTHSHHTAA
jgi:chromosomal replication initiator protein